MDRHLTDHIQDDIIIKLTDNIDPMLVFSEYNLFPMRDLGDRYYYVKVDVSENSLQQTIEILNRDNRIISADPNYIKRLSGSITLNDPNIGWHHSITESLDAWAITTGNVGGKIAIIDTGIDASHPDLAGRVISGYNFVNNSTNTNDWHGHGTASAICIAGNPNNNIGVVGMDWATKVVAYTVMDSEGYGSDISCGLAVRAAADNGCKIINMSFGSYFNSDFFLGAINYAADRGCIMVAAGGNDNKEDPSYPGSYPNVIGVASTSKKIGKSDIPSWWCNSNPELDVCMPGDNIATMFITGENGSVSGTSFSSPLTAGVVSLMLSVNPSLTANKIKEILMVTGDQVSLSNKGRYPRVNAKKAVQLAYELANDPDIFKVYLTQISGFGGDCQDRYLALYDSSSATLKAVVFCNNPISNYQFFYNNTQISNSNETATISNLSNIPYPSYVKVTDSTGRVVTTSNAFIYNQVADTYGADVKIISPVTGDQISSDDSIPLKVKASGAIFTNRIGKIGLKLNNVWISEIIERCIENLEIDIKLPFIVSPNVNLKNKFYEEINTLITSESFTISGINKAVHATLLSEGEMQVNNDEWTSGPATVKNGDTIRLRMMSPSTRNTISNPLRVVIGSTVKEFYVSTSPSGSLDTFESGDNGWKTVSGSISRVSEGYNSSIGLKIEGRSEYSEDLDAYIDESGIVKKIIPHIAGKMSLVLYGIGGLVDIYEGGILRASLPATEDWMFHTIDLLGNSPEIKIDSRTDSAVIDNIYIPT